MIYFLFVKDENDPCLLHLKLKNRIKETSLQILIYALSLGYNFYGIFFSNVFIGQDRNIYLLNITLNILYFSVYSLFLVQQINKLDAFLKSLDGYLPVTKQSCEINKNNNDTLKHINLFLNHDQNLNNNIILLLGFGLLTQFLVYELKNSTNTIDSLIKITFIYAGQLVFEKFTNKYLILLETQSLTQICNSKESPQIECTKIQNNHMFLDKQGQDDKIFNNTDLK
ncbi:hypothetical protein ABPG72_010454 [Tetrahymena utriculariae]